MRTLVPPCIDQANGDILNISTNFVCVIEKLWASFVYVFPLSYDKSTFAMLSINLSTGISKKILFASTYVGVIVIVFTALFS